MSVFHFKYFSVYQENTAMKVGTDSMLLGSWTPFIPSQKILDIGAGSGVLSLMLAQRFQNSTIHSVEINPLAFQDCILNVKNSPWSNKIICYNQDIQDFATKITSKFDLIISNPPFFKEETKSSDYNRQLARSFTGLSLPNLAKIASSLLAPNGLFSLIIPFSKEEIFLSIASTFGLFPSKITRVKGRQGLPYKRSLILLSTQKTPLQTSELIIEIDRNIYTLDYYNLTKEYHKNKIQYGK